MHLILIMADAFQTVLAGTGSSFFPVFVQFAHVAAPVAVTALWQSVLIAVALVLCMRFAPRVSAAHRFAIWAAAFAVVAALPLLPPFLPLFAHSAAASIPQASSLGAVANKPWLQLDSRWGFIVAALWLIASALRAADLAFHSLRLRKLWKSATPVAVDPSLSALLADASPRRRSIQICTTRELDRPSVIGFLAPRILIPDWLFVRLTPGELEHVIQHEAEHLRRRDDWTNLLQKLSLVLFPLNPALVWMERRLCREREMACDEGVVRRTQAPRAYAACLTSLAERSLKRRAEALSLGAFQRRPELVRRVHSILLRKRVLHPRAARALVGVVASGLLFVSVELARCPQMVAFVPEQSASAAHNLAAAHKSPVTPDLQRASNSLVRATDTADAGFGTAGYRVIETKAILPARHSAVAAPYSAASGRTGARKAAEETAPGSPAAQERELTDREFARAPEPQIAQLGAAGSTPHQVLLKAEVPDPNTATNEATSTAGKPQFIVLAAWAVVRTVPQTSRAVADYDTASGPGAAEPQSPAAESQPAAAAQQNTEAGNQSASQPAAQIAVTRVILAVYPVGSASPSKASPPPGSNSHRQAAVPFDGGWLVFEL